MSTINDSDLLLVERNGNLHQITYDQMSTLNDDDILLVERGGVQYKVEAQYVSTGPNGVIVTPVEVLTPINGAGITEFDQYEPLSSAITVVGESGTLARDTDEIESVTDISNWNQSQTWSSFGTGSHYGSRDWTKAFDGVISTSADGHTFPNASQTMTWTPSSPITVNESVVLYGINDTDNSTYGIKLNGGSNFVLPANSGVFGVPVTISANDIGGSLSSISLICNASQYGPYLTAVEVDGKRLVDAGIAGATITGKLLSFPTNTNFGELSVGDDVSGVNGGGSLYLDGDAVIKIASNAGAANIFNIQSNEAFSIEAWVYPTSLGSYNNIMSGWDSSCSYRGVLFHILDNGQIFFGGLGGATYTSNAGSAGVVTTNKWHHVAVTRNNGGDCEFYIDGVSVGSFSNSNAANNHNCGVFIGANMDGHADGSGGMADYRWHGYISNLRYVVGHETYTSNFTPPTEPLTPTSQNVPSGACKFLAAQDATSFDTESSGIYMAADYGTPVASEQNPFSVNITSIDAAATPPTITVDGGTWTTSDRLTSQISYEKSLTFTNDTQLANMVGPLEMADATGNNSLTPTTSNVVSTSFTPSASFFNTTLYTGNASSNVQTFDTSVDMQNNGGMIWFKSRQHSQAARIIDTYRGTRPTLIPSSNTGNNALGADGLTFLDDGFSIGWDGNDIASSYNYVAWSFAEKPGFFDIVTWDGNYTNREIAHNLGSVPGFIMVKRTSANEDWTCYHKSLGAGSFIQLNSALASSGLAQFMNNTDPTSTHFSIGTHERVNQTGHSYIAYIFADNPSNQIKCGSYAGTGPGMTVDVGFRPHWVMLKSSSHGSTNWVIADSSRPNEVLWPNSSDAAYPHSVSFTDTGFTLESNSSYMNLSGYDYIYIAIGEVGDPAQTEITFQDNTSLSALTSGMTIASNGGMLSVPTFSVDTYSGNNDTQSIDNGIDLAGEGGLTWIKYRAGQFGTGHYLYDTERGSASINSNNTNTEYSPDNRLTFDSSGFNVSIDGGSATNATDYPYVAWSFRKAPGFFDIQTWTGSGVEGREIPHNLGSTPGMIMIKRTGGGGSENWVVYHKGLGIGQNLTLNHNYASNSFAYVTAVSDTAFNVSMQFQTNGNDPSVTYVAYIFADDPSNEIKCGSYTGTGANNNNIDCGFEPKWVMIKNADESGGSNNNKSDWYISDHKRGFSSHYGSMTGKSLSANTNTGELSDATIVVSATGFKPATGGEEYGKSGIKYIYMAIGSPTASGGPAIGTLITDADPSTNKVSVDTTSWPTGNTVTGPTLSASLTSILEVSGNTIFGNGPTGTWMSGYYAEGSEINAAPPGPSEITFTSQNQGTPAFSGVDATLASRTWTLESGTTATGPWTVVDSYVDYDVLNSQDGSTPWTSNKPTLQPNTYYRIKVQYNSTNAESVESVYSTFKTGDA